MSADQTPAAQFAALAFPKTHELESILRELKRINPRANFIQADMLWRLRQGERVSVSRVRTIYPFLEERLIRKFVLELKLWDVVTGDDTSIDLVERAA